MAASRHLFIFAKSLQTVFGGALPARSSIEKFSRNVLLSSTCSQRTIFTSAINQNTVKVTSYGAPKEDVKVLDETGEDLGIMKKNKLKSFANEKNMKIVCIDEVAVPHPIYKLEPSDKKKEVEHKKPAKQEKVKNKELMLNSNISKHDLSIKIGNVLEWLKKNFLVNVRIQFKSGDQKYLEVYKEIVNATSSIAKLTEAKTSNNSMSFNLVSSSNIVKPSSPPKPLKLDELAASAENQSGNVDAGMPNAVPEEKQADEKKPEEAIVKSKKKAKGAKVKDAESKETRAKETKVKEAKSKEAKPKDTPDS